MEENILRVSCPQAPPYEIVLTDSFSLLAEKTASLLDRPRRVMIVSDSHVAPLYLKEVTDALSPVCSGVSSFVFPAGEEQKDLNTVRDLYKAMIGARLDRKDLLIALGGGVTGDLTGFAAATYMRGIRFIQIPTSLLAQVDSSIGGKTGVDLDSYKNMVGAFCQPALVYMNTAVLETLPDRHFSNGCAEIIKHGVILDPELFTFLEENAEDIMRRDPALTARMILLSCRVKRDVVEEDPRELGIRTLLNFGHSLGHAIERTMDFSLLHGECVALGMTAACHIAAARGLITREEEERVRRLLERFALPVRLQELPEESVLEAASLDKKADAGRIRFVLPKGIGHAEIFTDVDKEEMRAGLGALRA